MRDVTLPTRLMQPSEVWGARWDVCDNTMVRRYIRRGCRKQSLVVSAVILVMMFSLGSYSPMSSMSIQDTFETEGRQMLVVDGEIILLDQDIEDLYDRWGLQGGLQAAIYHDGSLVYANSFGRSVIGSSAGIESIAMENHHRMRIASLSKAITGAAIQTLVVSGQISTSDRMVDLLPDELIPNSLEGCEYPNHSVNIDDNSTPMDTSDDVQYGINDIRVSHLLNMQSGLDVDPPETNVTERMTRDWHYEHDWMDDDSFYQGKNNPCIDDETVAEEYNDGWDAPVKIETTIRETLRLPLNHQPGTSVNYSNIGYTILGEIIEEQSGMGYEEYVLEYVLAPMGIDNMQLGKTLFEHRVENEVTYYSRNNSTWASYFPLNRGVEGASSPDFGYMPKPYGAFTPLKEIAASGGWISDVASYARFISHLDGTLSHPNFDDSFNFSIINTHGGTYGNGIGVNSANNQNWSHTGALDGTSTQFERSLVDGESVVIVLMINNRPWNEEWINTTSIGNKTWKQDRTDVMKNAFTIDYKNATPLIIESADPVNIPAGHGLEGYAQPCEDVEYRWGGEYFPVVESEGWDHYEVGCDCAPTELGKGCAKDTPFVGVLATISMVAFAAFSQRRRFN